MIQGLLPLLLVALSTSHTLRATDVGRATHRLAPRGLPQPVSTPVTPPASIVNQTAPVSANVSKSQAHVPQNYSYGSHPDNSSAIPAQVDSVNGSNSTDIAGETEDVDEASKTSVKQNVTAPGTVPSAQSPVDGNSTSKIYGSLPINAEASQVNNGTRAGDDALESDEDPSSDDDDDLAINATLANQTNASLASQHDFNPKNISDDSTTSGSAIVNATQNNVPITTTLPLDQNNTLAVNSTSDPITQSSSNSNLTSITPNGFSQNDSLSHSSSQQNSSAIPMTGAFMSTLPNPCLGLPLTTETWKNLDLDTYLHSYPNGLNTSLQVREDFFFFFLTSFKVSLVRSDLIDVSCFYCYDDWLFGAFRNMHFHITHKTLFVESVRDVTLDRLVERLTREKWGNQESQSDWWWNAFHFTLFVHR